MRARRALAAAVSFALAAAPLPLAAQPKKPDASAVAEAKSHFDKGLKLYKEGALREALAEFLQANKLVPRASVLRNIAQCHRDLKNFAAAYADYAELLKLYGPTMKPAESKQVKAALADLAVLTGVVAIQIAEPGARVEIDGKDVGETPLEPVRVSVGAHQVVVAKAGFDPITKQVEIQGNDQATVGGELKKEVLTGHLVVTAPGAPAAARLVIDDKEVGPLPWQGDLPPGMHRLDLRGKDVKAATRSIELARGGSAEIAFDLGKALGHLLVDPHVADAEIKIDGQKVGKGVWEGELAPGQHEVQVSAAGFVTYRRAILIHDGERRTESVALESLSARVVDYRGFYATIDTALAVRPSPHNYATDICQMASVCQSPGVTLGPGGMLTMGYSLGYLGLEASGFFRFGFTHVQAGSGGQQLDTNFTQVGFGGGPGVRFFTKNPSARFTAGFRVLVLHEEYGESVNKSSFGSTQRFSTSGNAPALAWDLGLLLGSTPGVKFRVGAQALVELVGDKVAEPNSSGTLYVDKGTALFVGPTLGMQFGY